MRAWRRAGRLLGGAVIGLGAVIGWQAARLRRHELLPGHPGFYINVLKAPPGRAVADAGPPLRMLVFGDSTTAGVGVDDVDDALPSRLAELVAADRDRAVAVLNYGRAGARAADVVGEQVPRARRPLRPHLPGDRPPLPDADLVAVSVGANDIIHHTSPSGFRASMRTLLAMIRETAPRAEIVVVGIPRFRGALPQYEPLILLGDLFGSILRRVQRDEARSAGTVYADLAREVMGRLDRRTAALAADSFHPGPEIYRVWAVVIAEALAAARRDPTRNVG